MEPELEKKLLDIMDKYNLKLFGPASPEFEEYLKRQPVLDMKSIMGPNTHIAPHYLADGKVAMTKTLIRGYFETRSLAMNEEDVVLTSYLKCGTTWLQMICLHAIYDGDVEKVKSLKPDEVLPHVEVPECTLKVLKEIPSPKVIKTHLSYNFLPPGNCNKRYKIINIIRNPKDVVVSLYHFFKTLPVMAFVGDLKALLNAFLNDAVIMTPYDQYCLGYWERRNDDNVLCLTYEALHKDTFNQVKKICQFLGKDFTDDQIIRIVKATSFDSMAANPNTHHAQWAEGDFLADPTTFNFMRKGKIGDWKNHFDEDMNKRFDEWIEKRFGHADLKFDYE